MTSFCSITRPTRRETAQLDDLSNPLLGSVSDDTLRFVSASLSESPYAPPVLMRRLANLPPEISAPLLLRSPVLGNIDLLALIGRHGVDHARVIAARLDLDERIARLIASLDIERHAPTEAGPVEIEAHPATPIETTTANAADSADRTRDKLRTMMRPAGPDIAIERQAEVRLRWDGDPGVYRKLRSTALAGVPALFHTALADALEIDLDRAGAISQATDMSMLIVALRSLDLADEEAFLIVQCIWPSRLAHVRTISAFLDAYEAVTVVQATGMVASWRGADSSGHESPSREAANASAASARLKAS